MDTLLLLDISIHWTLKKTNAVDLIIVGTILLIRSSHERAYIGITDTNRASF